MYQGEKKKQEFQFMLSVHILLVKGQQWFIRLSGLSLILVLINFLITIFFA